AAAAESLKDQAIRLAASVSVFRVDAHGVVSRPAAVTPSLPAPSAPRAPVKAAPTARVAKAPPVLRDSVTSAKPAPVVAAAAATAAPGDDWETF
ncbi:MAG: hypothetical protein Q8L12_14160, partial [Methylibium sp.]|nr:hypothetical protein [Methylibium sp.]